MPRIVPFVATVEEHLAKWISRPEDYRPKQCPHCGLARLWCHGHYCRKADRGSGELNPVPVPRYYCPGCKGTCSALPSCMAPRRWYLWSVQQVILVCLLAGVSLERCAAQWAERGPALSTMRRWWRWLKGRHMEFAFYLRNRQPEWGRAGELQEFWRGAIEEEPLRELMASLDNEGLIVP